MCLNLLDVPIPPFQPQQIGDEFVVKTHPDNSAGIHYRNSLRWNIRVHHRIGTDDDDTRVLHHVLDVAQAWNLRFRESLIGIGSVFISINSFSCPIDGFATS